MLDSSGNAVDSTDDLTAPIEKPVISVIKVRIDPTYARGLLDEALAVLVAESRDMPGFVTSQVLLSTDNSTLVILAEWANHHAWGQSRYDTRVGALMEHCLVKSTAIEFEIYTRRGAFSHVP